MSCYPIVNQCRVPSDINCDKLNFDRHPPTERAECATQPASPTTLTLIDTPRTIPTRNSVKVN